MAGLSTVTALATTVKGIVNKIKNVIDKAQPIISMLATARQNPAGVVYSPNSRNTNRTNNRRAADALARGQQQMRAAQAKAAGALTNAEKAVEAKVKAMTSSITLPSPINKVANPIISKTGSALSKLILK